MFKLPPPRSESNVCYKPHCLHSTVTAVAKPKDVTTDHRPPWENACCQTPPRCDRVWKNSAPNHFWNEKQQVSFGCSIQFNWIRVDSLKRSYTASPSYHNSYMPRRPPVEIQVCSVLPVKKRPTPSRLRCTGDATTFDRFSIALFDFCIFACSALCSSLLWVEYSTGSNHVERGPIKAVQNTWQASLSVQTCTTWQDYSQSAHSGGRSSYLTKPYHMLPTHGDPVIILT